MKAFATLNLESAPVIHVVAGVITDPRGRILLARRTRGRDLAGLWEFPGGKVDPGEGPEQALIRELHEELGIDVQVGDPLITVPHRYPHKRLRLDVRRIAGYHGVPKGLDGQALAWVPPHKLASYAMPAADRPVVAALRQPDRYLVTPDPDGPAAPPARAPSPARANAPGDSPSVVRASSRAQRGRVGMGAEDAWLGRLQRALDGGIRRVQLRTASTNAPQWAGLVERAVALCREAGAEVLLNRDVALARALKVGVHLKAAQLETLAERPLPAGLPVAASCHGLEDLRRAEALGCDFAVLGPVRETTTHPGLAGIGWDAFAALREHAALPIYAIGGLAADDIADARAHGAQGIAAIRGLWPEVGPARPTRGQRRRGMSGP